VRAAHGISDEPVTARDVPKSMLAAKSFSPTSDWEELQRYARVLCEELAQRMADDSALHNRRPRNLVVHYRSTTRGGNYSSGTSRSRCGSNHAMTACRRKSNILALGILPSALLTVCRQIAAQVAASGLHISLLERVAIPALLLRHDSGCGAGLVVALSCKLRGILHYATVVIALVLPLRPHSKLHGT
jgi:hypothetical protein